MSLQKKIIKEIDKHFDDLESELNYTNPWQLLVAVILSAQSTDKTVNKITKKLFKNYPNVEDIHNLNQKKLQKIIYSSGFYRNKAKNIKKSAKIIINKYNKKVPDNMDDLLKLPGIGKKSANVILTNYFNKSKGIVVDTHVKRVFQRLKLTTYKKPKKIEEDLIDFFDKKYWKKISNGIVLFGRYICTARKPKCDKCSLKTSCNYYTINIKQT